MHRLILLFALAMLAFAPSAEAQALASENQPDLVIDAATRRAVVDTLCDRIERNYVFSDRAREVTKSLRKRMSARAYDKITSAADFADTITANMQAVAHDVHLRLHYRYEAIPAVKDDDAPLPEAEQRRIQARGRYTNYGFERYERLPGNVGYLDLQQFSGDPAGQATAVAAMTMLSNTDAMIIDLRRNGGGSPMMIATILTYFVKEDDRLLFNTFYHREGDKTEEYWTSPFVPGPRYLEKPLYVLTSNRTASAAEEFAYDVQTHKLGTVVGAVTRGGANPGRLFRLNDHFAAFVATGRAINPVTKTNWEGVGVKPDSVTKAGEAVRAAYSMALQKLIDGIKDDPDRLDSLKRSLEAAAQRPVDPEEDFQRPQRRRTAG
jgi:retinol-binding protein 3